jgi:tRNA dimethylallyltransferase
LKETIPLVSIMGPTGIGKTNLAFALCEKIDSEIISVDSVQIYKQLDIGSGKPSQDLLERFPHKLINKLEPAESYSTASFNQDALDEILLATEKKKLPLLVGGTMLYFHSLLGGLSDMPKTDPAIRERLKEESEKKGLEYMHDELRKVDPESGNRIHPNDSQRILRALEVFMSSKKTLSDWHKDSKKERNSRLSNYKIKQFALEPENKELHRKKIANRFHEMIENGFVNEVEGILNIEGVDQESSSMKSVGYRQICQYLDGKISYDEMIFKGITATRQLAKRQMTWLKSWDDIIWLKENSKNMVSDILNKLSINA